VRETECDAVLERDGVKECDLVGVSFVVTVRDAERDRVSERDGVTVRVTVLVGVSFVVTVRVTERVRVSELESERDRVGEAVGVWPLEADLEMLGEREREAVGVSFDVTVRLGVFEMDDVLEPDAVCEIE